MGRKFSDTLRRGSHDTAMSARSLPQDQRQAVQHAPGEKTTGYRPKSNPRRTSAGCGPACGPSQGVLDRRRRSASQGNEWTPGIPTRINRATDLTAQRIGLHALGVGDDRIYVDHGLTGTNRDRPGLRLALAACRAGDTLVVTKLDRLARSLSDARDILTSSRGGTSSSALGGSVHDPTDTVGRLLFNVLAIVAEFETDLIRLPTRDGMKVAKAKGRLRGKQPKLNPSNPSGHSHIVPSSLNTQISAPRKFQPTE
jgi:hypothetical protein